MQNQSRKTNNLNKTCSIPTIFLKIENCLNQKVIKLQTRARRKENLKMLKTS